MPKAIPLDEQERILKHASGSALPANRQRAAPGSGGTVKHKFHRVAAFLVLLAGLGVISAVLEKRAAVAAAGVEAPQFEVDPFWPKPLPNHWIQGMTFGVSVDSKNHILFVRRQNTSYTMEFYATATPPPTQCS